MFSCVQVECDVSMLCHRSLESGRERVFLFNLKVLWSNHLIVNWFVYMYICDILMFFILIYIYIYI